MSVVLSKTVLERSIVVRELIDEIEKDAKELRALLTSEKDRNERSE